RQLATTPVETLGRALRHALGFGDAGSKDQAYVPTVRRAGPALGTRQSKVVLIAASDAELERQLKVAGFAVKSVAFTPFDAEAASKIRYFETYNRTAASQQVADIVAELRASPDAALVATGDAALAGLMAAAIAPSRM